MNQPHHVVEDGTASGSAGLESYALTHDFHAHWYVLRPAATASGIETCAQRSVTQENREEKPLKGDWSGRWVGIIAKSDNDLLCAVLGGRDKQGDVFVSDDMINGLHDVLCSREAWEVVFFKFEDFGTITSLFRFIRSFRLRCPSVPLVLVSDGFLRDDLGPERLPLCDASLKLPTSAGRVHSAMNAARANNALWVSRLTEYRDQGAVDRSGSSIASPTASALEAPQAKLCSKS